MRRFSGEFEQEILKLLRQGASYRMIAGRLRIAIASVSRVAEDARKETVDYDSLRTFSILLRKEQLTIFDVTRAHKILEAMNRWGISAEEVLDYVMMNEKYFSEKGLDERFLFYAVKLEQLEGATGQTYEQVVKDHEEKTKQADEAKERKTKLDNESLRLAAELRAAAKTLAEIKSEIVEATAARQGVAKLGVHKLAKLVRFVQDFESIGYKVDSVIKLAVWRRELQRLGILPDRLDKFIAEKGPLEAQNNNLKREYEGIRADTNAQKAYKAILLARNAILYSVEQIMTTRTFIKPCSTCKHLIPTRLPTRETIQNLIDTGKVLIIQCPKCGVQQLLSPWEIALHIAWTILPTEKEAFYTRQ